MSRMSRRSEITNRIGSATPIGTAALTRKIFHLSLIASAAFFMCPAVAHAQGTRCGALKDVKLGSGSVESAVLVLAGDEFTLTGAATKLTAPRTFCRVLVHLHPTSKSDIRSEFWLPDSSEWNRKFLAVGNGGFGGGLENTGELYRPLRDGFAGGASDMGHRGTVLSADWAHNRRDLVIDWAYRANHLTAETGKHLVRAYYGKAQDRAYFHGCSDGGREALMEAGRYPGDYDGIVVGAPAAAFTDLMAQFVWNGRAVAGVGLTQDKLNLISAAVMAQCDGLDSVKDGVLENPQVCHFRAETLACRGGNASTCLTPAQVEAVRKIYDGPKTRSGVQISQGFSVGNEAWPGNWPAWITGPISANLAADFFRWMVYAEKDWTSDRFNLDRDLSAARTRLASLINSDQVDVRPFLARGGKLLMYHGWSDAALPPRNTIKIYERLRRSTPLASNRIRLFMAPGMSHCGLGPGPNVFDAVGTLDKWVKSGIAPERIVATKYADDAGVRLGKPSDVIRTRPLCPWPKVARWNGKGSSDRAENFTCAANSLPVRGKTATST